MEKSIRIINRDGKALEGVLTLPKNKTDRIVIITTTLSYWSSSHPVTAMCAKKLSALGFAALRFTFYGSTLASHITDKMTIASQTRDLEDVLSFATRKGYKKIAIIGPSLGGTVSIFAYNKKVNAIVLLNPVFDLNILYYRYKASEENKGYAKIQRSFLVRKIGKKMWQEFAKVKVDDKIPKIRCPVLIVYGDSDDVVPRSDILKYYKKFKSKKKFAMIKNGDHDFFNIKAASNAASVAVKWLQKQM